MKNKVIGLSVAVLVALSSLAGCSGTGSTGGSAKGDVIKVATVTPLSGSQAAIGESIKNGAQLALEERVTEFGKLGIALKLDPQDDQADPKVGVAVANRLINDKDILAVVGHYNSGVAIPSSEVYKKVNLVMVSPANTGVQVTERGYENINRICTRDDVQGPAAADFAQKELGAKSAFVVHDKTTYGQGVADEFKKQFEKSGGQVAGYEGLTAGESDFSAVLNKVASTKPDVLYFGGMYPEGSLLIKQMKEKQITAKFIGPDGMDSGEVIKIAGQSAIDTYFSSMAADVTQSESGKAWAKTFEAKYKKAPENWSVYGYDAMNVTLNALKNAIQANGGKKPTREQVVKAARQTKGFKGIAASVSFNSKGDNEEAEMFIYKFKEAKYPPSVVKSVKAKDYLK